jgi:acyl carrier protein
MPNRDKLKRLIMDTFLLEEHEFSFDLRREQVESWDSLGVVAIGVGIKDTFGYHPTAKEATALAGVPDIIALLEQKGFSFAD